MRRISRLAVLAAALMSLFAVMSSTAGAVTWHNTGDSSFTATGGAGTLTSTGVTLGCSGSNATGTVPGTPFVGATFPVHGTIGFNGCTLSGQATGVHCTWTLTSVTTTFGPPHTTSGNIDVTCSVYLATSKICHIEGALPGAYANPSGATPGRLVVSTSSNLTLTNGSVGTCPLGNGDKGHLTQLTFNVSDATPPLGPVITRTA